jgi:hypothetical protein
MWIDSELGKGTSVTLKIFKKAVTRSSDE